MLTLRRLTLGIGFILTLVLTQMTSVAVDATGGTISINGLYRIHTFTNTGSSTFTVNTGGPVEVLVVAGRWRWWREVRRRRGSWRTGLQQCVRRNRQQLHGHCG